MTINKSQAAGKIILALDGRLDTTTSSQLQDALIPAFDEAALVEIDFTKLDYVSSAGLRVLLMGQKTAQARGASMALVGVSAEIMEVLEMTGLSGVLTISRNTH